MVKRKALWGGVLSSLRQIVSVAVFCVSCVVQKNHFCSRSNASRWDFSMRYSEAFAHKHGKLHVLARLLSGTSSAAGRVRPPGLDLLYDSEARVCASKVCVCS